MGEGDTGLTHTGEAAGPEVPPEAPRGLLWAPQAGGSQNMALCPGGLVGAGPEQVKVCSLGGLEARKAGPEPTGPLLKL